MHTGTPAAPQDPEKLRVFVALALESDARVALTRAGAELRRAPWAEDVRWVPAASLHLTLRFLGDIEAGRVRELVDALRERLRGVRPFVFSLGSPSFFPTESRPRVIVARVTEEPRLAELAAAVEQAVVAAGHRVQDRRFRAHITLGRFRRAGRRSSRRVTLPCAEMEETFVAVNDVVVFRSELGPGGARYSELGRAALVAPSASATGRGE